MTDDTGTIAAVRSGRRGAQYRFRIANAEDVVQRHLSRGRFYSEAQLARHADFIVPRRTVVDIGANVGNHTVYYATHTRAGAILPFEPNPAARALLAENVALNALTQVDLANAHFGLGRAAGRAGVVAPARNLGAGRLVAAAGEDAVEVRTLDSFGLDNVSFVKIDVEGMEIDVLAGAAETLARNRPVVAIEVDPKNNAAFFEWCAQSRYHVVDAWRQHVPFDYLCVPMF